MGAIRFPKSCRLLYARGAHFIATHNHKLVIDMYMNESTHTLQRELLHCCLTQL